MVVSLCYVSSDADGPDAVRSPSSVDGSGSSDRSSENNGTTNGTTPSVQEQTAEPDAVPGIPEDVVSPEASEDQGDSDMCSPNSAVSTQESESSPAPTTLSSADAKTQVCHRGELNLYCR